LDRELTPGALDLGEIVVPPPAGEVMLASIEVMLDGRNVTDEVGASLWPAEGRRQPHPTVTARSPGRVELRGWPLQGDGEIQCWHPLTSPARAALRSGHHHIIELRRGVSLELSIEPPPVPPAHFRARLVPGDGSLPQYTGADDGRMFRWRNQAPGAHRLQVLAFETVVYDQPIVLRAGANVWPPAGERIDLSRTAAAARVAARGPDGERIDCETLVIPADASELPSDWEHRVDSTEWIPLRGAAVDVLVRADGWVPARVRNVSTDTVVTMQRLTTVVFEPPLGGPAVTVIAVVRDGLDDALLRSFQTWTWTTPFDLGERTEPAEYTFAPGAELDVHLVRGGVADVPRRIVVEAGGPQRVELR
jgi:hypothetical protein